MIKIGHAHDIHQLQKNRKLILGGVEIEHEFGLFGHSDADVLIHAITEAIIGALGLGDIGTFFPDTAKEYEGIDSMILLSKIVTIMQEKNFHIINIDATIFAQRPKMLRYVPKMKEKISNVIGVDSGVINIKSTTGEKLGYIGREEGIAAEAVILISND